MNNSLTIRRSSADVKSLMQIVAALSETDRIVLQWLLQAGSDRNATGLNADRIDYARAGAQTLTPREKQVLVLVVSGLSNKEAARSLKISPRTVEVYRERVRQKLGARNTAELCQISVAIGYSDMG